MKHLVSLAVLVATAVTAALYLPGILYSQAPVSEALIAANALRPGEVEGEYHGRKIPAPTTAENIAVPPVLGYSSAEKRIEVDLTNQRLYAYAGDEKIYDFLISSGKWGRTPTGTFEIWAKVLSTKMEGGSKALRTYYNLPRVPYTMFFYNKDIAKARGYAIHGAYWHNNFGHPMSHGCINMKPEEASVIYQWAEPLVPSDKKWHFTTPDTPSTKIIIYGTAPKS